MNTQTTETLIPALQEGEQVNLVEVVTAMLFSAGHPQPQAWLQGLHPDAINSNNPEVQRFLINRYWRGQIAQVPGNTLDIRYCLVDQGQYTDWIRLFKNGVLPCIMDNQLPKTN